MTLKGKYTRTITDMVYFISRLFNVVLFLSYETFVICYYCLRYKIYFVQPILIGGCYVL